MAPVASEEGGARDAGEARQDDAPEPLQGREEAGEQEEGDYAAEEEQGDGEEASTHEEGARDEGEAGQDDASEPLQGREEAGEQDEDGDAEEEGDEEEDPTHLPFAPSSESEVRAFASSYSLSPACAPLQCNARFFPSPASFLPSRSFRRAVGARCAADGHAVLEKP